jgi:flagellin-specific chaperone FliS
VHLEDIIQELGIEMDGTKTTEVAAEIRRLYFGNKSVSESSVEQHIEVSMN